MTTPLSQMPKPEAGQYKNNRKLFLVPTFMFPPGTSKDGLELLDHYWSEVRDHVNNLESSLGQVVRVYHEAMYVNGDDGMVALEQLNPQGYSFIRVMIESSATLEATEDQEALKKTSDWQQEASEWQRCMSFALMSQAKIASKVAPMASEGYQESVKEYQESNKHRYEYIGSRIDETLNEGEAGILFIQENHRVQFPSDLQVFYVSPPGLDAIKRWIDDQMRGFSQNTEREYDTVDNDERNTEEPKEN